MFILLIRNQSRLCAQRGLDSQASERSLWAQLGVCKLWLKHRHRDFKTAGKLHPKPSHCCSETPQQSSGRGVYCVDCWSSGSRLFNPEMLPTVAVWFLAGVHVLGALCSWTFLIKSTTLWFWLCVFTCWHEDTTSCTIKPVCNNVQNQKAHAAFMSCGNKWGNDFLV